MLLIIQVRTSYLPNEILWGYRFENTCVTYDKSQAKYVVNIGNMDKIVADNTPRYKLWALSWDVVHRFLFDEQERRFIDRDL